MAVTDHGVGRQLRRDQHAPRLPPARRLPHHGGGRHRRGDPHPRRAARPARVRHRRPRLPRPRHLDGPGHLLARPHLGAARGSTPTVATLLLGAAGGRPRGPARLGDPLGRADAAPPRAPQPGPGDHRARRCSSASAPWLPAHHRATASRRCSSPGRTPCRTSSPTPPTTRSPCSSCSGSARRLAYGLSLSAFRGGPVFPAMFIGAVLGIAVSGLPGMDLAPAIGMGIGAMCCAMLRLPLTSVLLADPPARRRRAVRSPPQVVVAVVVAYVVTTLLPDAGAAPAGSPPVGSGRPDGARRLPTSPRGVSRGGGSRSIVG